MGLSGSAEGILIHPSISPNVVPVPNTVGLERRWQRVGIGASGKQDREKAERER